jgi:hypothetical protein
MDAIVTPMVLGTLLIVFTVLWFGIFSWMGMHEDDTGRRRTRTSRARGANPWWTNKGFEVERARVQEHARTGHASH